MTKPLACAILATLAVAVVPGAGGGAPTRLPNEFFALDTAMVRNFGKDLVQPRDIETVAALGYSGLAIAVPDAASWRHLSQEVLPRLDARKLKLHAVYVVARLERAPDDSVAELERNMGVLKGRDTVIWLTIASKGYKPSQAGDDLAVALVREVAAAAAKQGLRVSLYPHIKNVVERVSDAVRLAENSGRADVGVTLNLCHWLRTEGPDSMVEAMKLALPRLSVVTINGADRDGKQWIQPLDSGDFDVAGFLRKLHELGYRGPIGLQGSRVAVTYGIEPAENLRRSMAAWEKLSRSAVQP